MQVFSVGTGVLRCGFRRGQYATVLLTVKTAKDQVVVHLIAVGLGLLFGYLLGGVRRLSWTRQHSVDRGVLENGFAQRDS